MLRCDEGWDKVGERGWMESSFLSEGWKGDREGILGDGGKSEIWRGNREGISRKGKESLTREESRA